MKPQKPPRPPCQHERAELMERRVPDPLAVPAWGETIFWRVCPDCFGSTRACYSADEAQAAPFTDPQRAAKSRLYGNRQIAEMAAKRQGAFKW